MKRISWILVAGLVFLLVGFGVVGAEEKAEQTSAEEVKQEQAKPEAKPAVEMEKAVFIPQAPTQKVIRLHQVKAGENLHLLSAYYYGDARKWRKIWELNKKQIPNPNLIRVGQILKIEVEPGWKPKFDLEQYKATVRARIERREKVKKEPKIIREKKEVRPTTVPRLIEETAPSSEETKEEER